MSLDSELSDLINRMGSTDRKVAYPAKDNLIALSERSVPALITALGSDKGDLRMRAKDALVKIGQPAVPALIDAMRNPNATVREYSADALGDLGDARAYAPLKAAQRDSHPSVIEMATVALGTLHSHGIVDPDGDEEIALPAVESGFSSPTRPAIDMPTATSWIFFEPERLRGLDAQAYREIRRAMALPVALLLWLPLLIPLIGLDIGIYVNWMEPGWLLGLMNLAALSGVFAVAASGWWVNLQEGQGYAAIVLGMAVAIPVFFISAMDAIFLALAFGAFGVGVGLLIVACLLAALTVAGGVAQAAHLFETIFPIYVAGGVLAFLIIDLLGTFYLSFYYFLMLAIPGLLMHGLGNMMLVQIFPRGVDRFKRVAMLVTLLISNAVLIWVLLFNGWWILIGRPDFIP